MIIGIVGPLGAGKAAVAEYLVKHHKFQYFSVRNFYAGETLRLGRMVNHDSVVKTAAELRAQHGGTWALEQLLQQVLKNHHIVIESIRTKEEAQYLKSKGAALWAVDANPAVRYKRSVNKDMSVGSVSFDEFQVLDAKNAAAIADALALADATIRSDGTLEQLGADVETAFAKLSATA